MPRFLAALALIALAGCGSDPEPARKDELSPGPFRHVIVNYWSDPAGGGSSHVAERSTGDGSRITREHLVAMDGLVTDEPGFWADISIEGAPDRQISRVFVTSGIGAELASAPRRLSLARGEGGRWARLGADEAVEALPELDGCVDIEVERDHASLGHLLRRLNTEVGSTVDIDIVVVSLPGLDVSREKRRLTHVDAESWTIAALSADGTAGPATELRVAKSGELMEFTGPDGRHTILRTVTLD